MVSYNINYGFCVLEYSKPAVSWLLNIVIPKAAAKYYEMGIELYKDSDVYHLDTIAIQNGCAMDYWYSKEMFKFWLVTYGDAATWDRLIRALKAPGLQRNALLHWILRE